MALTVPPLAETVQPLIVPASAVGASPLGSVSATVTGAVVGPMPEFETLIV